MEPKIINQDFLRAFARVTKMSREQADEQWSAFSSLLSISERLEIEAQGSEGGREEGEKFIAAFPDEFSARLAAETEPD